MSTTMGFIITISLWLASGLLLLVPILMSRNERVCSFRSNLLECIRSHLLSKIDEGTTDEQDIDRIFSVFDAVSYPKMVYQFWKPLKEFYPKEFLNEIEWHQQ